MENRFGSSGLGSELVHGRRDVDYRDSERTRPTEEPYSEHGTYSTYLSSPSCPKQAQQSNKSESNDAKNSEVAKSQSFVSNPNSSQSEVSKGHTSMIISDVSYSQTCTLHVHLH